MLITAPKFEAVFNNGGRFFRLLQDSFHPPEYVDGLIAEIYERQGFVTYIVDDALVHYMKTSFKRMMEGRRAKFPNYEIIGLSKSGFTPYDVPAPRIGNTANFVCKVTNGSVMCGSTQLKRKMVLTSMLALKQRYAIKEVLFFIAYSDEMLATYSSLFDTPVALMAADMPARMSEYFGPWSDWYYLRCSHQDQMDVALVNSHTCELHVPQAYGKGVGDHSFFKQDASIENWIALNTSLTSGQAKNTNVQPDFSANIEVRMRDSWHPVTDVDVNWGGLGRGRDDSFGNAKATSDYGPQMVLRIATQVRGLYFCGIFMRTGVTTGAGGSPTWFHYTPLPVKNQATLKAINDYNQASFE